MIFRRILFLFAAISALAVAAGVLVVALAYALFALMKPYVGSAGAAAVVAGATCVLIALLGVALTMAAKPPKRISKAPERIVDRIADFVRTKPVTAVAAAVATGLMAVRNPKYLGEAIRAFVEGRDAPRR
ncbi:MAG TPA: hypothetical protein VGL58_11440 [Caulobacteraceae bacterium]